MRISRANSIAVPYLSPYLGSWQTTMDLIVRELIDLSPGSSRSAAPQGFPEVLCRRAGLVLSAVSKATIPLRDLTDPCKSAACCTCFALLRSFFYTSLNLCAHENSCATQFGMPSPQALFVTLLSIILSFHHPLLYVLIPSILSTL